MDIRQINAVTSNEPGKWFDQHDFNFLLTHHPPNWLSPDALHHFNSEISRPGRFDIHFFGHVHEAKVQTTIVGGGAGRRISQAASLFGIERIANENVRLHGYAVGSITQNGSKAELNIWPRRARSSDYALIANAEDFDLVPPYRQHMAETIATFSSAGSAGTIIQKPVDLAASVGEKSSIAATALKRIEYYLPKKEQHKSIRNVERKRCLASFNAAKPRPIWICADWGSGRDGFLWSVLRSFW
ncbi:metallophosphoesterase family protein, partial [Achromobacter pulmonis]|uniref:metallophosphoesterase family protein n=1 Tax=Achromobacter pulmonis TaxID=1389932 RepID=UPI001C6290EC